MKHKIELLSPAGSLANLKAAVSKGGDAVYLGMNRFSARDYATNFNRDYLSKAIKICKSNNVNVYLAMNTLVKNSEIRDFFEQLSFAYSKGIDAVIIQENSFINLIKKNYPDLRVHMSTQASVMNSSHANLLSKSDRITLARELSYDEIKGIRSNYSKELEIFGHGALCVCISGQCLFSSFLGGRSGNRGKCAQPCRKKYENSYYFSTKELCLIDKIPEIIESGVDSLKIEGRMRTPYYVATVTEIYRKAIDNYYSGEFKITDEMKKRLKNAFSREFTQGWFNKENAFNRNNASGESKAIEKEMYNVKIKDIDCERKKIDFNIPEFRERIGKKEILVRVYNKEDAILADLNGANVIYMDLFDENFVSAKKKIKCKLFGVTPRIMLDSDEVVSLIKEKKPDGLLAGNNGVLSLNLNIPIHLDYNINCFNDIDMDYYSTCLPIVSPELSIKEMSFFKNKDFVAMVHGKIRLMILRHDLDKDSIRDNRGEFIINKIRNGSEVINGKELGLLGKSRQLLKIGVNKFFIDTDKRVGEVVKLYRDILDGKQIDDSKLKKEYVLGWSFKGVI